MMGKRTEPFVFWVYTGPLNFNRPSWPIHFLGLLFLMGLLIQYTTWPIVSLNGLIDIRTGPMFFFFLGLITGQFVL